MKKIEQRPRPPLILDQGLHQKCVWVFQVSTSLSRSSSQRCCVHMWAQMRPWRTYLTCVGVQWGSASLVQNPSAPDETPERYFVRACMILTNRRWSAKVLFSNNYAFAYTYMQHLYALFSLKHITIYFNNF